MRVFTKSSKLENVLYDIRGPVMDEAARMEEAGEKILKLNIGNPAPFGFEAPDEVIHDIMRNVRDCEDTPTRAACFLPGKRSCSIISCSDFMYPSVIYTQETVSAN